MNIINLINSFVFSNTFISSITVILLGLSLRVVLATCKQLWVTTFHQTMTFMILPLTTFMITKVIAGNIALSLGLVGALSIVRFRNPVKNSFELVMFFVLVSLGITGSSGLVYPIALTFFVISIIIFSVFIEKYYFEKNKKRLFSFSFTEGEKVSTLEVEFKKPIDELKKNDFLINEIDHFSENTFIYKFASPKKTDIQNLHDEIKSKYLDDIINIEYVSN